MAHNKNSNKKKKNNKESKKEEKATTSIGLHQATHNSSSAHNVLHIKIEYMHPFNSVSHINEFLNQIDICLDHSCASYIFAFIINVSEPKYLQVLYCKSQTKRSCSSN